jgi:hypothetical protein
VSAVSANALLRLSRATFPLYLIALALSFASELLCVLAAKIAGDEWPR